MKYIILLLLVACATKPPVIVVKPKPRRRSLARKKIDCAKEFMSMDRVLPLEAKEICMEFFKR